MQSHHITVSKTARYHTMGTLTDQTKEIWFVIHGFAQLSEQYLSTFAALDNGERFFIAPEALNKFYLKVGKPEVGATWMTREDRETEINDYKEYLNQLYDSFLFSGYGARIIVLGFSQGVATVSRWIYQNPRKVDTLIFYAGEPANELQNEASMASFNKTKNYFIVGTEDQFINELNIQKYREMLADFKFISFEGKHEITTTALENIK
jgi:predicted esterase